MNKVYFATVLHFHQPVGNFKEIFQRAYQRCYKPFLELLSSYPDIKATLHISGGLMDYFRGEHPRVLKDIRKMVLKGQVEIISGPYYEPILPATPPRDFIEQIKFLSRCIEDEFWCRPTGMWIPERVWHPRLVKYIYKTGMRYCILDDTHFLKAGIKKKDTYGYFMARDGLRKIAVFPSDKSLRYTMPFKPVTETIKYLKGVSVKKDEPLFVYGDDVEKFGEWPQTNDWVYKKGWLKNFFDTLIQNREWIKTVKLTDYLKTHRPSSTLRIPEAAYEEMMEWTGGSWLNFLKKYPESNHMHKKMEYVSEKVERIEKSIKKKDKDNIYWAKMELYKGQCNCGYWHGLFGGLYMYHLRSAIYNHLIAAENITDAIKHKEDEKWIEVKKPDLDGEFIAENKTFSLYFDPKEGGVLKELDYRPICLNLVNTLSRKREEYHKRVASPLKEKLVYDKYTRYCLRDYFISEDLKKEDFISASFKDYGDFSKDSYTAIKKEDGLILERSSLVKGVEIELSKEITLKDGMIEIFYKIKNIQYKELKICFGTEFNLTMPFLNSDRYRYFSSRKILGGLNTSGAVGDMASFGIMDRQKEMEVKFNFSESPQKLWYFPVETVSQSETTYRLNHQCSCIFPVWRLDFDKGPTRHLKISWHIG